MKYLMLLLLTSCTTTEYWVYRGDIKAQIPKSKCYLGPYDTLSECKNTAMRLNVVEDNRDVFYVCIDREAGWWASQSTDNQPRLYRERR